MRVQRWLVAAALGRSICYVVGELRRGLIVLTLCRVSTLYPRASLPRIQRPEVELVEVDEAESNRGHKSAIGPGWSGEAVAGGGGDTAQLGAR